MPLSSSEYYSQSHKEVNIHFEKNTQLNIAADGLLITAITPHNFVAYNNPNIEFGAITNFNADCYYGVEREDGFVYFEDLFIFDTTGGTVHSTTLTQSSEGLWYTYIVCMDEDEYYYVVFEYATDFTTPSLTITQAPPVLIEIDDIFALEASFSDPFDDFTGLGFNQEQLCYSCIGLAGHVCSYQEATTNLVDTDGWFYSGTCSDSFDSSEYENGYYEFDMWMVDAAGNEIKDTKYFTIDRPLTLSLNEPEDFTTSVSENILLNATFTSTFTGDETCGICITTDGLCDTEWTHENVLTSYSEDLLTGTCKYLWPVSEENSYQVIMGIKENFEDAGETAERTIIMDKTSPLVSITYPEDSDLLNYSFFTPTWSADDNFDDDVYCEFYVDEIYYEFEAEDLSDGLHTLEVICADNALNLANDSIQFTIDTTLPEITINEPIFNQSAYLSAGIVDETSLNLGGCWVCITEGEPCNGDWKHGTMTVNADNLSGTCSYEISTLDYDGIYTLSFRIQDSAQNANIVSSELNLTRNYSWSFIELSDNIVAREGTLFVYTYWGDISQNSFTCDLYVNGAHAIEGNYATTINNMNDGCHFAFDTNTTNETVVEFYVVARDLEGNEYQTITTEATIGEYLEISENTPTIVEFNDVDITFDFNLDANFVVSVENLESNSIIGNLRHFKGIDVKTDVVLTNLNWAIIKFYYTDEELANAGIDESTLSVYYFNETSEVYELLSASVNTDENYILVNTTHFSIYSVFGADVPPPSSSSGGGGAKSSKKGGGGGGGGSSSGSYVPRPSNNTSNSTNVTQNENNIETFESSDVQEDVLGEVSDVIDNDNNENSITGLAVDNETKEIPKGYTIAAAIAVALAIVLASTYFNKSRRR
ncbi:MAG TPA: hypothetical protein VEC16_01255 [Alphaproteobacteria bacterium]|nr:hypothetical protein [Alphaproteobacteria bacterium]